MFLLECKISGLEVKDFIYSFFKTVLQRIQLEVKKRFCLIALDHERLHAVRNDTKDKVFVLFTLLECCCYLKTALPS